MILRVRVNSLSISAKAAFVIGPVKFYAKKKFDFFAGLFA